MCRGAERGGKGREGESGEGAYFKGGNTFP